MSREIHVLAQADHIVSLSKATPLSALEELVWNALDADAKDVRIDLMTNALGAVEAVRVSDDGIGIDIAKADATFGGLGGSWKRAADHTEVARRRLHGCHGCGRFKAFAIGTHVEWRTTVRDADGMMRSYTLWGDLERPGVFQLDPVAAPGPGTGTEVFVGNVRANADSLLNATETIEGLASKFALYLKAYPDVRIYFNGIPVTPVIVQCRSTDYRLTLETGAEARVRLIEWKRKFQGAGRMVFAGENGFALHERSAQVRSGGVPFTAYLLSPRFSALNAENALVMDELNPEVRAYIDGAKKILKAHFIAMGEMPDPAFAREWKVKLAGLSLSERRQLLTLVKKSLKTPLTDVAGK